MGSLSEYFRFLSEKPDRLSDTVISFSHITISEEMKRQRRELKLYRDEEQTKIIGLLDFGDGNEEEKE